MKPSTSALYIFVTLSYMKFHVTRPIQHNLYRVWYVLTMTTVPTLNFLHVIHLENYIVFEDHTLVVGKWLLYFSKVTPTLSVVFWIFRCKCSFSSPISHVRTWTIVHNMNLSHMKKKKKFKSDDENWCYL